MESSCTQEVSGFFSTAADIRVTHHGAFARAAALVINRQRPSTASGVIFVTLEDETSQINLAVWPWVAERQRHRRARQRGGAFNRGILEDHSRLLGKLETKSRDFQ